MSQYHLEPKLTKDLILQNVSEEEIFEYFLKIPVEFHVLFNSPLRADKNPTCSFKYVNGKLLYRDWAEDKAKDCFDIVQEIYNCDFYQALTLIKTHLLEGKDLTIPEVNSYRTTSKTRPSKSKINVKLSTYFQPEVKQYLQSYHLSSKECRKFNIYPITHLWVNGRLLWIYSKNDPAIGYYFGKDEEGNQRWKIYFFTRKQYRFIGNTNRINGWIQLPKQGDTLVITKSLKDVACLSMFDIPAISMQNESTIPYDYIIEECKERFNNIVSLYDFDRTGVINANKLYKLYGIPYLFLTNGKFKTKNYGSKDFSDFIKANDIDMGKKLVQQTREYLRRER